MEGKHTPGPWEKSHHQHGIAVGTPNAWQYVAHNFDKPPYEGDLAEEYGIYPPLGESGPVAIVAGENNARLIAAAPDLLAACEAALEELYAPDVNCSCHVCPPCSDCVDYASTREAIETLKAAIAKARTP